MKGVGGGGGGRGEGGGEEGRRGRRKPKCLEDIPDEFHKMPHTKVLNFKPKRDSNPHFGVGGRL